MFDAESHSEKWAFSTKKAENLRTFAKQKRYTAQEITAFEISQLHPHRAETEAFIHSVFIRRMAQM